MYKTWIEVSKSALENNVRAIRKLLRPETKLMAVVKSNAYGHGPAVAGIFSNLTFSNIRTEGLGVKLLKGVDWFGVDSIDEAIDLRKAGFKKPILVLGYTDPSRFKEALQNNLRLTIYDADSIHKLKAKQLSSYKLHLKVDTGMSRQGILVNDLPGFLKQLPKGIDFEGVFSHFADADNLDDLSYSEYQLAEFNKALNILSQQSMKPNLRHISATAGLISMPEAHFDMVRAGIGLYGLYPSVEFAKKFKHLRLKSALSWKTRVVQLKNVKKDTAVGYGITEKVKKDTRVAVLPIGYYEGFGRILSSVGEVLIKGKRCKILGRVSMNLTTVDVSGIKNVRVGDETVLIGPSYAVSSTKVTEAKKATKGKQDKNHEITVEEIAQKAGTINYEIVSRINPLLPRIYKE